MVQVCVVPIAPDCLTYWCYWPGLIHLNLPSLKKVKSLDRFLLSSSGLKANTREFALMGSSGGRAGAAS